MATVDTTKQTLTEEEVELAAREFLNSFRNDMLFQSRLNRDAVWRAAKRMTRTPLTRRSTGYQQLDPRYTFEGSGEPDLGLGNDYKHGFANLYELSKARGSI
jgi:hypothetical protein